MNDHVAEPFRSMLNSLHEVMAERGITREEPQDERCAACHGVIDEGVVCWPNGESLYPAHGAKVVYLHPKCEQRWSDRIEAAEDDYRRESADLRGMVL